MSAPERIWVQWPHVNGAGLAFSCQARPPASRTEYVRADLPPTLSAALAVPQVAAMVEAAKIVHQSFWHESDGVIRGMYDLERALAALAAWEA